jgi:hypothetical protein
LAYGHIDTLFNMRVGYKHLAFFSFREGEMI